jgi:hypothetical protein
VSTGTLTAKIGNTLGAARAPSADIIDLSDHTAYLEMLDMDCQTPHPPPKLVVKEEAHQNGLAWLHREDSLDRILFAEDDVTPAAPHPPSAPLLSDVSLVDELFAPKEANAIAAITSEPVIKREPSPPIDLSSLPDDPSPSEAPPADQRCGLRTPSSPPRSPVTILPTVAPDTQDCIRMNTMVLEYPPTESPSPVVKRGTVQCCNN